MVAHVPDLSYSNHMSTLMPSVSFFVAPETALVLREHARDQQRSVGRVVRDSLFFLANSKVRSYMTRELPLGRTEKVKFHLPMEQKNEVQALADAAGMSLSEYCARAVIVSRTAVEKWRREVEQTGTSALDPV